MDKTITELPKENTPAAAPVNKIAAQAELVDKLTEQYKAAPSDDLKLKLQRETDVLRYYSNEAQGNPKERSKAAYTLARAAALNRAVQQVPPEDAE